MKKMLWGFAATALVLSSCSSNEVFDEPSGNNDSPNAINFMTSTTKAVINTVEQIKPGFTVYASNAASLGLTTPAWYLSDQTYKFDGGVWKWDPTGSAYITEWPDPAVTDNYPVTFAAYYPQTPTGFAPTATTPGALKAVITVQEPTLSEGKVTTNHYDYLAAKSSAAQKPAGGLLALSFNHIMSKINAAIIPGNNRNVYVQAVSFKGAATKRTYNYMTPGWETTAASDIDVQTYFNAATATTAANKAMLFNGTDAGETTATPFYTGTHSNNLMLIPQITNAWDITSPLPANGDAPDDNTEAYIEVIYRMTNSASPFADLVGYTDATKAPGYGSSTMDPKPTGPLFVKVGFPLTATWDPAKGYMYKIKLGTDDASGGFLVDKEYIDENGDPTQIPIKDGNGDDLKPGDQLGNGKIGFIVDVNPWVDADPQPGDIK